MKRTPKTAAALAGMLCFALSLGGCADAQLPVQTKNFSTSGVQSVEIDYDGEGVTVLKSESDQITVVEYMDKSRQAYWAKMELSGGVLTVTEGARPIGNGVHSTLELYLPEAYQGSLSLHTTNGRISSGDPLTLSGFRADTTNGTLMLSNLSADELYVSSTGGAVTLQSITAQSCSIHTTNADARVDSIAGAVTYESRGGNLTLTAASGSGQFQATGDGSLDLAFTQVSGDLTARTKNGTLTLTLPGGLDFAFSATTKNGSVQTPFSDLLSASGDTLEGTIGGRANRRIGLETKNGDIKVNVPT